MNRRILLMTFGNESSIEFVKSLTKTNKHSLWGCHYDTMNAGRAYLTAKRILQVPSPFDEPHKFLARVEEIVTEKSITDIVYTNCKMMKFVYDNWDDVPESIRCVSILPDRRSLEACLFKHVLYKKFPGMSPLVFSRNDADATNVRCFAKPFYGSSGQGTQELLGAPSQESPLWDTHVITEYLPGQEFTVDCVSDRHGRLKDYNVRIRERIRDGITAYGKSVADAKGTIESLVRKLAEELKLSHVWFAQFKFDAAGIPKLLEVNCRISGSFCITKAARKDYVAWFWDDWNSKWTMIEKTTSDQVIARHMAVKPIGRQSYVFDLDGTICTETRGEYHNAQPIREAVEVVNRVYRSGAEVIVHTARGMKRYNNDAAMVYAMLYDTTRSQLASWGVEYDKLIMGKPCGTPIDEDGLKIRDVIDIMNLQNEVIHD